ncbi:hypothetical protein Z945_2004 [Sulfitobacter noctilucae]|nr:hypothetical protein Z945_2004 [Sulfitobacter noctilucae]
MSGLHDDYEKNDPVNDGLQAFFAADRLFAAGAVAMLAPSRTGISE